MRKVIVSEMATVDGFFAGPNGEIQGLLKKYCGRNLETKTTAREGYGDIW